MFEIETTMLVASPGHQKQVAIAFEKHGYLFIHCCDVPLTFPHFLGQGELVIDEVNIT